jgi:hypothetical protein
MNRDEAKYILRAYHLGGEDAADPQFQEALELSKRDPALASWFANEQAIDARLSRKLLSFPVPADLKTQLLAARKIVPLRPWWQRPAWVSAAACFISVLALSGSLIHLARQPRFADFRSYVVDTTAQLDHLDLVSTNLVEVRRWLVDHHAPSDFVVPAGINESPSVGCREFNWKGQRVSLICFKTDKLGTVHLFVIDRATLHSAPSGTVPQVATSDKGITTAAWSSDQRVYVLAGKVDETALRRLL